MNSEGCSGGYFLVSPQGEQRVVDPAESVGPMISVDVRWGLTNLNSLQHLHEPLVVFLNRSLQLSHCSASRDPLLRFSANHLKSSSVLLVYMFCCLATLPL